MVNVLIFGGTGFIGFPTALALRARGHRVIAALRTPEKSLFLRQHEITPIIAAITDTEIWTSAIVRYSIDVVIDVSSASPDVLVILAALHSYHFPHLAPRAKLAFIYYSGVWINGNAPAPQTVSDLRQIGSEHTPDMLKWRPAVEEAVLAAVDKLDVVVVRPGVLFGGDGSIFRMLLKPLFEAAEKKSAAVDLLGHADQDFPLVHRDDLAEAGVKVVEKVGLLAKLSYPVFNIVSHQEPSTRIIRAVKEQLGYEGEVKLRPAAEGAAFEQALLTNVNVSSDRLKDYTGWEPRHTSFAAQADVYVDAMLANFEAQTKCAYDNIR